jgi:hypothetical protein
MLMHVKDVVGENCITLDDGQKVYLRIHPEFLRGFPVTLDFTGVKTVAAPFLNAAIGQLLKDVPVKTVFDNLNLISSFPGLELNVVSVINHSNRYYNDDKYRNAVDQIMQKMVSDD